MIYQNKASILNSETLKPEQARHAHWHQMNKTSVDTRKPYLHLHTSYIWRKLQDSHTTNKFSLYLQNQFEVEMVKINVIHNSNKTIKYHA